MGVKPYVPSGTKIRFFVPRTLAADFDEFLSNDVPNTVMDFKLLPDWYDQFKEGYEAKTIRAEIYPDDTKSRYSNTDNNMNIRASVDSGIKKGDMIVDPDGMAYLLDWEVAKQSNNAPSRALRCNMFLTMLRYHQEVTDDLGYLVEPEGYSPLFENLPVNVYRYDGRPEFTAMSATPGVLPNALTLMTVQYNDLTKDITEDDRFVWCNEMYTVIDVDHSGVNEIRGSGVMVIQAKKTAGGDQ